MSGVTNDLIKKKEISENFYHQNMMFWFHQANKLHALRYVRLSYWNKIVLGYLGIPIITKPIIKMQDFIYLQKKIFDYLKKGGMQ